MKLGVQVGLGPGHTVLLLDRDPAPLSPVGQNPPIFGPYLLWPNGCMDQDATWYGGRPQPRRLCVTRDRSSPLKGAHPPIFGSCLLSRNGWMDEDATWYGNRPQPRQHCIRRAPALREGGTAALFSAHVYCGHGRPSQLLLSSCNTISQYLRRLNRLPQNPTQKFHRWNAADGTYHAPYCCSC